MQYGRKAFGPQRRMSPQTKARNIARSIVEHGYRCDASTWQRYGIDGNKALQALVRESIASRIVSPQA